MGRYLQRIVSIARTPSRSIHPIVGSLYSAPKTGMPDAFVAEEDLLIAPPPRPADDPAAGEPPVRAEKSTAPVRPVLRAGQRRRQVPSEADRRPHRRRRGRPFHNPPQVSACASSLRRKPNQRHCPICACGRSSSSRARAKRRRFLEFPRRGRSPVRVNRARIRVRSQARRQRLATRSRSTSGGSK